MIHVCMHICTLNHFRSIVREQIEKMRIHGLYNVIDGISCFVVGSDPFSLDPIDEKAEIVYQNKSIRTWEWPTLQGVRDFGEENPEAKILYLHTKGISQYGLPDPISRARRKRAADWRRFMEYYVIERWRDCVAILDEADIVGVNLRGGNRKMDRIKPWRFRDPHFGGNFWWAKGSYLAGLSKITTKMTRSREDAEFWVGHNAKVGSVFCNLFESEVNHDKSDYPRELYEGKIAPDWFRYNHHNHLSRIRRGW